MASRSHSREPFKKRHGDPGSDPGRRRLRRDQPASLWPLEAGTCSSSPAPARLAFPASIVLQVTGHTLRGRHREASLPGHLGDQPRPGVCCWENSSPCLGSAPTPGPHHSTGQTQVPGTRRCLILSEANPGWASPSPAGKAGRRPTGLLPASCPAEPTVHTPGPMCPAQGLSPRPGGRLFVPRGSSQRTEAGLHTEPTLQRMTFAPFLPSIRLSVCLFEAFTWEASWLSRKRKSTFGGDVQ